MAVDPIGSSSESGATVITSAALALSQQARQGVSQQVEQIAQHTTETKDKPQELKPVEDSKDSANTENQPQHQAAESSSSQIAPTRGQTVNIEG